MKAFIRATNSMGELILLYGATLAAATATFAATERLSFSDALWWAVSTSLTFGNAAPTTDLGRLTSWLEGVVVVFVITPLLIARLIRMHESGEQTVAWRYIPPAEVAELKRISTSEVMATDARFALDRLPALVRERGQLRDTLLEVQAVLGRVDPAHLFDAGGLYEHAIVRHCIDTVNEAVAGSAP